jgi:MYXO-CTERM domain-containing protein
LTCFFDFDNLHFMKTLPRKPASIAKTRWAAYAAAGAATALVGSNSAEAAIHYSGLLHVEFPPGRDRIKAFPLDQPGDFLSFVHSAFGGNEFAVYGIVSAAVRGSEISAITYVAKLSFGQAISTGLFSYGNRGNMAYGWHDRGTGYVGFRFNNGAGIQYGWARVTMSGEPDNAFIVRGYAYADPGEPIRAGQRSSDEQAPNQSSLGWLALGAAGLLAWRRRRGHAIQ